MIDLDNGLRQVSSPVGFQLRPGAHKSLAVLAGLLAMLAGDVTVFAQASGSSSPNTRGKVLQTMPLGDDCLDNNPADIGPPLMPPIGGPPATLVAETTITLPPRWRGEPVECTFDITNAGEGDLYFKPMRG